MNQKNNQQNSSNNPNKQDSKSDRRNNYSSNNQQKIKFDTNRMISYDFSEEESEIITFDHSEDY